MQTNLLWTGREYYSLENCLVTEDDNGAEVRSAIIGLYEGKIYQVQYYLRTNPKWEVLAARINCRHDNHLQDIRLQRNGQDEWLYNGREAPQFTGCTDVDIPLTPFTNTLPIRRLNMKAGQAEQLKVLYCDLLNRELQPVHQSYTRLSAAAYHYENIPNDFEADIQVDAAGFVTDYPALFTRTAIQHTNY